MSCGLISVYLSTEPKISILGYWLYVSIFFSILIYYEYEISETLFLFTIMLFSACVFLYVFAYLIPLILDYSEKIFSSSKAYNYHGFENPRFLNQIQTWCIPLLIISHQYITKNLNPNNKLKNTLLCISYFSISIYISLILITGGRGTIVAYLVSTILLWLYLGRSFSLFAWKVILFWLSGITIFLIITQIIPNLIDTNSIASGYSISRIDDSGRFSMWLDSIKLIYQSPIFGIGPFMYTLHSDTVSHPHNSILWFTSEWGIPSTLSLSILLIIPLFKYLYKIKKTAISKFGNESIQKQLFISYGLALSICTSIIHSLVSGIYLMPGSQLFGMLVVILSLSNYRKLKINNEHKTQTKNSIYLLFIFRTITIALFLCTLTLLYQSIKYNNWNESLSTGYSYPGFWLNGNL